MTSFRSLSSSRRNLSHENHVRAKKSDVNYLQFGTPDTKLTAALNVTYVFSTDY